MQTKSFQSCGGTFDLQSKKNMIEQMRLKSNKSDFWKDKNSASSLLKDISILEKEVKLWETLDLAKNDVEVLLEFAESGDVELKEVSSELNKFILNIQELELKMILGDEMDAQDAIITIHPGAGGTESQDWAAMLRRMYTKWASNKDFKFYAGITVPKIEGCNQFDK